MSDRGLRRLFDRLVELGAVRELSGRPTLHLRDLKAMAEAVRRRGGSRSDDRRSAEQLVDRELDHLPPEARWREWIQRIEATISAASEPVDREVLARIVGKSCSIDLLIDDIREELRGQPYDLVAVAGGWKHLTRPVYADAIRAAAASNETAAELTQSEVLVLMCVAYFRRSPAPNSRPSSERKFRAT